jgi:hypothetical protein
MADNACKISQTWIELHHRRKSQTHLLFGNNFEQNITSIAYF